MAARRGVDELAADVQAIGRLAHAALEHVADTQLAAQHSYLRCGFRFANKLRNAVRQLLDGDAADPLSGTPGQSVFGAREDCQHGQRYLSGIWPLRTLL